MVVTRPYLTPRHDHDTEGHLTTFTCSDGFSVERPSDGSEGIYAQSDDVLSVTSQQRSRLTPESSTAYSPSRSTTPFEEDSYILDQEPFNELLREATMDSNPMRSISPETLRSGSDVSRTRSISSTNSSHSLLLPQASSAYRSLSNSETGTHITSSSPTSSSTPFLRTANTMSSREKKRLLRSHRKLSKILGETPVLSTTIGSPDVSLAMIDELGTEPGRTAAGRRRSTVPVARHDNNAHRGSLAAHHAPRMRRASSPIPSRSPPVLRIDTAASPSSKRPRQNTSSEAEGDAISFISTTTTTTMMLDALHPHRPHSRSRRSPLSPVSTQSFLSSDGEAERAKEKKRAKMAKLTRHLGENVPSELVFPVVLPTRSSGVSSDSAKGAGSQGVSVETWSSNVARSLAATRQSGAVHAPPRRSSLAKRRKRISLSLDFYRRRSIQPTGAPIVEGTPDILYSHSLKQEDERSLDPRLSVEADRRLHDQKRPQDDVEESRQVQVPLNDKERSINVRRAQKMSRVFGTPPPSTMLQGTNTRALTALDEEDVESVRRLKRHSFHSIISAVSIQTERTAVAREGLTQDPTIPGGEAIQNSDRVRTKSMSPPSAKKTHRRGQSLTDVPPTPPPFSRYFQAAPTVSPRASTSTASSSSVPRTPSPTVGGLPIGPPMPLVGRPSRRHLHSPSSPSAVSVATSCASHSPHSPRSPHSFASSASTTSVADKLRALDPVSPTHGSGAGSGSGSFAVRRNRATKLTRFFGVAYGELFPAAASSPTLTSDSDVNVARPFSPSACTASQIDISLERKGTTGKSSSRTRMPLSLRPILGGGTCEREQRHGLGGGREIAYTRVDQDAALKSPLEGVSVVVQRDVWRDEEYASGSMAVRETQQAYVGRGTASGEIDYRKQSGEAGEEASVTFGRSKRDASMLEVLEKLRELR